jgi:glucosylceramidase
MYGIERKQNLLRMFVVSLLLSFTTCAQARETSVQAWVTTGDKTKLLARGQDVIFGKGVPLPLNIDIDADTRYQEMVGFGAAITDASAWLIQNRMNPTQRLALMQEMFGPAPGIGLSFTRLTIGASEYSRRHYSFDDMPPGESDPALAHFSIDANRADVLPVVKMALAINPQLRVMATPWSAPGWMKTSDSLIKGSLRPEFYGAFADYLLRYVDAYAAEGVPIYALTLQNEPHFEPADYPGMRLDPAVRARLIGEYLGPRLAQHASPVRILDWDHNWNEPDSPLKVLADPVARPYVAGVAWHCYEGEETAQTAVHDAYPDKETYFTECASGTWEPVWGEGLTWVARKLIVGSTRGWAKGVLFWNLALDENFGPHLGGCPYCRGVVTIDSVTGAVTRNSEYYVFAHASRFVRPGARRIESSTGTSDLSNVAFRNKDDGSLVLIVVNSSTEARRFSVQYARRNFAYELPGKSVATFVWNSKQKRHELSRHSGPSTGSGLADSRSGRNPVIGLP